MNRWMRDRADELLSSSFVEIVESAFVCLLKESVEKMANIETNLEAQDTSDDLRTA